MKILKVVTFCAAAALPQFGQAASAADASAYGTIDAITSYCEKIVPSHSAQISQRTNAMLRGRSDDGKASRQYRDSYAATTDQLARGDKKAAVAACTAFAEGQ